VKLGFGEVLSESFEFFFSRLRLFFHLVTVPWILSILLRIAGAALTEESLPIVLAEKALDVVPTVMFMVAWMRVVLLGPARVDRPAGVLRGHARCRRMIGPDHQARPGIASDLQRRELDVPEAAHA